MNRTILAIAVIAAAAAAAPVPPLSLIPQPVSEELRPGSFQLRANTVILVPSGSPDARRVADLLAARLASPTGFHLRIAETSGNAHRRNAIIFTLAPTENRDGYELDVTRTGVHIRAASAAGLFYGSQTLIGLFPPQIESNTASRTGWVAPAVKISDYPRFAWRGLMLDCSRHFFPKEIVERYIDEMVKYKLNTFHWHLTDDQGWRIEIKSLPLLTKVGAWRVPRMGHWGERPAPREGEAATDGGFYTQDDIREIVAYARDRFVTIIPEIEMPGHSLAALTSYPELSCTGGPSYVDPGSHFYTKIDNAFCPGNEKTFEFMDKVFTEVAALFPGAYVHIGGDECYKGFWKQCPKCQRRMAEERLKTEEELQSYLVRRAEKILESKGKRLLGWDEILEGGLAPNATVMSWRGIEGGIAAAGMKHQVVMTPNQYVYLDLYQGDPSVEPDTYGRLLLKTSYSFEPVPAGVEPKFILGGQGNLWAENVPNLRQAEYMTWPRTFALAEIFWSPKTERNWDDFVRRVEANFERLDQAQVNYSRAMYDVGVKPVRGSQPGRMAIELSTEVGGAEIYYTFDSTLPDNFAARYAGQPVAVPEGAHVFKVIAYRNGKPSGRMLSIATPELERRLKRRDQ